MYNRYFRRNKALIARTIRYALKRRAERRAAAETETLKTTQPT